MRTSLVISLVLLLASLAHAVDVTSCGQEVRDGDVGVLQADLVCPTDLVGPPYVGVQLDQDAVLQMNGHSITGQQLGVFCFRDCTIVGPGEITGATSQAIGGGSGIHVTASDLDIHDNGGIADVAGSRLTVTNVVARRNGYGIRAQQLRATNLSIADNTGDAILVQKRFVGSDVTITGGGEGGVTALSGVRATRLAITGTPGVGLFSRGSVVLRDSSVTGSVYLGLDVLTRRLPRLLGTSTCGGSARLLPDPGNPGGFVIGPSWGVCAND